MQIVSHRGNLYDHKPHTENSLEAFEAVIQQGFPMIEMDVRSTLDQKLIMVHDAGVGEQYFKDLDYKQAEALLGYRPPFLKEVLELCKDRIKINLEIKENTNTRLIVETVQKNFRLEDVVFTSFIDSVIKRVKQVAPEAFTGLLLGDNFQGSGSNSRLITPDKRDLFPVQRLKAVNADCAALHWFLMEKGVGDLVAANGYKVVVWTANPDEDLKKNLEDKHVWAVITDRPLRARELQS